jgi:dTDP-glucose 4,6-dehydratase
MVMAYHRSHRVNTGIIRVFNTFGTRMRLDDGRVLPNFVGQALRGEPLTVYGDGSQTRSFCYVDDLVDGIERLLLTDFHEPVNLGNPDEVTILQFAREILALSGSKSKLVFKPLPQDDPRVRKPDITRAKQVLGWQPLVSRREGLAKMIEFYRGQLLKAPPPQQPQQQAPSAYPVAPGGVAVPGMIVPTPQQPGQPGVVPGQTAPGQPVPGQPVRRPGGGDEQGH